MPCPLDGTAGKAQVVTEEWDILIAVLHHACRPILADYPIDPQCGSDPTDAGLLHLTGEMLADAPSDEYDEAARADVVNALRAELAGVPAFKTEVGPPIGNVAEVAA